MDKQIICLQIENKFNGVIMYPIKLIEKDLLIQSELIIISSLTNQALFKCLRLRVLMMIMMMTEIVMVGDYYELE